MHHCTIAEMHQRTNELLQGIISQIKYEISKCTGCYYWGSEVWLKTKKIFAKIFGEFLNQKKKIVILTKNVHWCIGVIAHLSIGTCE